MGDRRVDGRRCAPQRLPRLARGERAVIAVTAVLVIATTRAMCSPRAGARPPRRRPRASRRRPAAVPARHAAERAQSTAAPGRSRAAVPPGGGRDEPGLAANPTGQLSYNTKQLAAKAGSVSITMTNMSPLEHNVTVAQGSTVLGATPTFMGGSRTLVLTSSPAPTPSTARSRTPPGRHGRDAHGLVSLAAGLPRASHTNPTEGSSHERARQARRGPRSDQRARASLLSTLGCRTAEPRRARLLCRGVPACRDRACRGLASSRCAGARGASRGLRRHADEEQAHVALWEQFARAAGAGGAAEGPRGALPQTRECVRAWTAGEDLLEHLAVLYAIEAGQPELSTTKLEGLTAHYGYGRGAPPRSTSRCTPTATSIMHARRAS